MKDFLNKFADQGTSDNNPDSLNKRIRLGNQLMAMVVVIALTFIALNGFLKAPGLMGMTGILFTGTIVCLFLNNRGWKYARFFFTSILILEPLLASSFLTHESGFLLIYIPIIGSQFVLFDKEELIQRVIGLTLTVSSCIAIAYFDFKILDLGEKVPSEYNRLHFYFMLGISTVATSVCFIWLIRAHGKAEESLKQAKEKAQNAANAKTQFLGMMSHEIRTPLHGIVGITDILMGEETSKKVSEDLKVLKYAANNLRSIVDDILDFSKLEAGRIKFEAQPFDLRKILNELVASIKYKIEKKKLKFSFTVSEDIPEVIIGDPFRLNQILLNLLDNATKFTIKGQISLKAEVLNHRDKKVNLLFSVSDSGIGIPEDKLDSVFESFSQATDLTTREFGGTGLGLSICHKLVTQQGGTMTVKSQVNKGTSFSFNLIFEEGQQQEVVEQLKRKKSKTNFLGMKMLLVEDNLINQFVTKQTLQSLGIVYNAVNTGEKAIETLRNNNYDMVMMDYHLPAMDGLEATRIIRDSSSGVINPSIPVVIITADVLDTVRSHILSQGATEFLTKPIEKAELVSKLQKIVEDNKIEIHDKQGELFPDAKRFKHIDFSYVSKILGSDQKIIKELFKMVMDKTPDYLRELKSHHIKSDHRQLAMAAQNMKSNFKNIGAFNISNIMAGIEEVAKKKNGLDVIDERLEDFDVKYAELQEEIYEWMSLN